MTDFGKEEKGSISYCIALINCILETLQVDFHESSDTCNQVNQGGGLAIKKRV